MSNLDKIPNLKSSVLTERLTLAISKEMKEKLFVLKSRGKDTTEMIRQLISDYLSNLDL